MNLKRVFELAYSYHYKSKIDQVGARVDFTGSIDRRQGGGFVSIGSHSIVTGRLVCNLRTAKIQIGDRVFVGRNVLLDSADSITIGDDVMIAYQAVLSDHDSHSLYWSHRKDDVLNWKRNHKDWTHVVRAPIVIGEKSWIGAKSIILKGVQLGPGCVVAAGSVVTRSFPAFSLVGGNPARMIRPLSPVPPEASAPE